MIDLKLLGGFGDWLTDEQIDIGGCRVAFVTEQGQMPIDAVENKLF